MKLITKNILLYLDTRERIEILDITGKVEEAVSSSGITEGICIVSVPHATASVVLNEKEDGLIEDLKNQIEKMFPRAGGYRHNLIDDNASSHLAASFMGNSRTIPVSEGKLLRGTWQNILFIELDGPRRRRQIVITLLGVGNAQENE